MSSAWQRVSCAQAQAYFATQATSATAITVMYETSNAKFCAAATDDLNNAGCSCDYPAESDCTTRRVSASSSSAPTDLPEEVARLKKTLTNEIVM